jgi:hypothetical protein
MWSFVHVSDINCCKIAKFKRCKAEHNFADELCG